MTPIRQYDYALTQGDIALAPASSHDAAKQGFLMLVSALVPRRVVLFLYALARSRGFKFLPFGDAMLIV